MGAYGTVELGDLIWTSGEEKIKRYDQSDQINRWFCSDCGCYLASFHVLTPSRLYLSLGCLTSGEPAEIEYQQFLDSKACWVEVDQKIKGYREWPDWVYEELENQT